MFGISKTLTPYSLMLYRKFTCKKIQLGDVSHSDGESTKAFVRKLSGTVKNCIAMVKKSCRDHECITSLCLCPTCFSLSFPAMESPAIGVDKLKHTGHRGCLGTFSLYIAYDTRAVKKLVHPTRIGGKSRFL